MDGHHNYQNLESALGFLVLLLLGQYICFVAVVASCLRLVVSLKKG